MQIIETTFAQLLNQDSMKHIDYKTFNSIQVLETTYPLSPLGTNEGTVGIVRLKRVTVRYQPLVYLHK